jgi:pyruvate/2-oxoglutarate dehydrogenase complex dihydrolipoamide acyltransferase (E2) component
MIKEIQMPKFGQTMKEGTIVNWEIGIGDYIEKGALLLEIESDKATLEVESEYSGYLLKIVAQVGDIVPCGQIIAYLGDEKDEQI